MAEGGQAIVAAPLRQSPFGPQLAPRRLARAGAEPGVWLRERAGLGLWQIAAWRAAEVAPLRATLAERLGLDLPESAAAVGTWLLTAFQIAPRRWWLVEEPGGTIAAGLAQALAGRAALTDLAHARSALRLGGPQSRSVLAGLCRIDLHPSALPPGRSAQTALAQVPVLIHALSEPRSFDLYLPRSYAGSALAALLDAAEPFGLEILDQGTS
jgi:sarcosine oxidase subunit gamma